MASQPNKHNSLAAFARGLGISPATARQWKRRGKITVTADGFTARTVTDRDSGRDSATKRDASRDSVTAGRDGMALHRDSVTARDAESVTASRRVETLEAGNETLRAELASVTADRDRLRLQLALANLARYETRATLDANMCDAVADQAQRIDDCVVDRAPDWGA